MSVFGTYSRYYDLLYRDKDYASEAAYVSQLIRQHRPDARSILDLGCGTGRHAFELNRMGYSVTGVDRSEAMLEVARAELARCSRHAETARASTLDVEFRAGDIRTVRLGKTFDVVVSLFHVMSYQTKNEDLRAALATLAAHLEPGGLFIFDGWYGPAVLSDPPRTRVRRLEDDALSVTRIAEPVLHENDDVVDVNYHVFVKHKPDGALEELRETHSMRYLFAPELRLLLDAVGLELKELKAFMSDASPSIATWNAVFVGARRD